MGEEGTYPAVNIFSWLCDKAKGRRRIVEGEKETGAKNKVGFRDECT
jgi:hypothetical protein